MSENLNTNLLADSKCITDWQVPEPSFLKWKNIDLAQSLANLREIYFLLESFDYRVFYQILIEKLGLKFSDTELTNLNNLDIDTFYEALLIKAYQTGCLVEYFLVATNSWENFLKTWLAENNKKVGDYLWPLRVALSGRLQSPSPFELLSILTRNQVLDRIKLCLQ